MGGLAALRRANFDWVMRLDDVWRDIPYDVPELNTTLRSAVLDRCWDLKSDSGLASPLGWVLLGPAGAGKTHLLAGLRREASSAGITFILVDMTDVRDFWETVLLGYLSSLREPENDPQCRSLLEGLFKVLRLGADKAAQNVMLLAKAPLQMLVANTTKVIQVMGQRFRQKTIEHQDVVRALMLLNSNDFLLSNLGYNWLLGLGLEPVEAEQVGIRQARQVPIKILRGLSWVLSLRGPTLLALDQLDAIVTKYHSDSVMGDLSKPNQERDVAQAIIDGIGGGLTALGDHTFRTLRVVSCLESTWDLLRQTVLQSSTDRFEEPKLLHPVSEPNTARRMVERRLAQAFKSSGFTPDYPSWPFLPEAFGTVAGLTPRELLKLCEKHRRRWVESEEIIEVANFTQAVVNGDTRPLEVIFEEIDKVFAAQQEHADIPHLLDEENEDGLGTLIQSTCHCLIRESPLPDDVDVLLETKFGGGKTYAPLHARICLVYVHQGGQETHICFRALQKNQFHGLSGPAQGGHDRLGHRPGAQFSPAVHCPLESHSRRPQNQAGGQGLWQGRREDAGSRRKRTQGHVGVESPGPQASAQVRRMAARSPAGLQTGSVPDDRPRTQPGPGPGRCSTVPCPDRPAADGNGKERDPGQDGSGSAETDAYGSLGPSGGRPARAEPEPMPALLKPTENGNFPLGYSLERDNFRQTMSLPLSALIEHSVIMTGSGAGNTILVRQMVERAALLGIPSVVIDSSNELARLGDPWPDKPRGWTVETAENAQKYHESTEVLVWTPGRENGRPLTLPVVPDFSAVAYQPEALEETIALGLESMQDLSAGGWVGKGKRKKNRPGLGP